MVVLQASNPDTRLLVLGVVGSQVDAVVELASTAITKDVGLIPVRVSLVRLFTVEID